MSRVRVVNGRLSADNEQAMTQAWHSLVDTLRTLPASSGRTGQNGDEDRRTVTTEKQTLDAALEQLSTLLDMRRAGTPAGNTPRASPAPVADGTMTPPHSGGMKRKRRPSVSISASPAPVPAAPHTGGSESALSSVSSPLAPGRGGKTSSDRGDRDPKRRLPGAGDPNDQLPLRSGRRIAVKQRQQGADEEEWILATVKKMIGGDRTRYEVQDADDGTRWSTSMRYIIPLPDKDAPNNQSCHPNNLEDFPKGTQVLALYPDTTSFYKATVVSPPLPGTGMGRGVRGNAGRADPGAKNGQYRLAFVEDGDNIHDVDKDLVVIVSPTWQNVYPA